MSINLSLIIDPAGINGVREGINLQVFPDGGTPLSSTGSNIAIQRTANNSLLANTTRPVINFSTQFTLNHEDFTKLKSLYDFNINSSAELNPFETVIYNIVEPYTEIATARTRFRVPDTVNLEENPSTYFTKFTYWVALQGAFNITWEQKGSCFVVQFTFEEGTKLTSNMEL